MFDCLTFAMSFKRFRNRKAEEILNLNPTSAEITDPIYEEMNFCRSSSKKRKSPPNVSKKTVPLPFESIRYFGDSEKFSDKFRPEKNLETDSDFEEREGRGGGLNCSMVSRFLRLKKGRRKSLKTDVETRDTGSIPGAGAIYSNIPGSPYSKPNPTEYVCDTEGEKNMEIRDWKGIIGANKNTKMKAGADVSHPRKGMVSLVQEDRGPPTVSQQKTALLPASSSPAKSQETLALFLNPLRDRLTLIEELTKGLEGLQKEEKSEYERCVAELAGQVSRAVALQQVMKSEVERLQLRVVHLENNNKAMATMIIPTLMKLEETVLKEIPPNSDESLTRKTDEEQPQQQQQNPNNRVPDQQQLLQPKSQRHPKSPLKSLQSFQSNKEAQTTPKKKPEQKTEARIHRKISECRIPRMSNGRLSQSPGQFRTHSPNTRNPESTPSNRLNSTTTSSNNEKTKSESRNNSNNINNRKSSNSTNSPTNSQTSLNGTETPSSRIGRLSSPLNSHPKSRKSVVTDLPPNSGSKLPIRKTASSSTTSSSMPTKHPAATSKSLPNQTPPNSISKPNSGKYSKSNFGFMGSNVKKSPVSQQQQSRPLQKLGCTPKGKDEGYSTMSSEALAEQEAIVGLKDTKKPVLQEVKPPTNGNSSLHKSNTFNTFRELGAKTSDKFIIPPSTKELQNYTSLPKSQNHQSCYSPSGTTTRTRTTVLATASVLEPASITTTTDNVRIVGGSPYEIRFSESVAEDSSWDEVELNSSRIIWEDSDDSDVLFLPIEISSEDLGSESTLIPHSERSSKTSSYTSWTSSDPGAPLTDPTGHPYPLRKSKGEDFTSNPKAKASGEGPLGSNALILRDGGGNCEERELIEKWMRLEDVRNEVQWEEEWAWDWDGVERTNPCSPPKGQRSLSEGQRSSLEGQRKEEEEFWLASRNEKQQGSPSKATVPNPHPPFCPKESGLDAPEGPSPPTTPTTSSSKQLVHIDSSTWTKSSRNKMKKVLEEEETLGNYSVGDGNESFLINETHLLGDGGALVPGEDGTTSPPVIQFTPDFYRLANYGSNLSFSENEPKSPKFGLGMSSRREEESKMDDKISQTDFIGLSFENLSISSDLFSECRNCLEIIKSLVGERRGSGGESGDSAGDFDGSAADVRGPTISKRLSEFERRIAEMKADAGCPTTWLPVPKGVPTKEVDRILEILSSSESEDVLSPSK